MEEFGVVKRRRGTRYALAHITDALGNRTAEVVRLPWSKRRVIRHNGQRPVFGESLLKLGKNHRKDLPIPKPEDEVVFVRKKDKKGKLVVSCWGYKRDWDAREALFHKDSGILPGWPIALSG